jgi:hypothetical protein
MKYFLGVNSAFGAVIGAFNCVWFGRRIYFKDRSQSVESDLISLCEGGFLLLISSAAICYLVREHRKSIKQGPNSETNHKPPEKKYDPDLIQQPRTLDNLPNFTINSSSRIFRSTSALTNSIAVEQKKISELTERKAIISSFITFLNTWKNILVNNDQNEDEKIILPLKKLFETIADKIADPEEDDSISDFLLNRVKDFESNGLQFLINILEQMTLKLQNKISGVYPQLEN